VVGAAEAATGDCKVVATGDGGFGGVAAPAAGVHATTAAAMVGEIADAAARRANSRRDMLSRAFTGARGATGKLSLAACSTSAAGFCCSPMTNGQATESPHHRQLARGTGIAESKTPLFRNLAKWRPRAAGDPPIQKGEDLFFVVFPVERSVGLAESSKFVRKIELHAPRGEGGYSAAKERRGDDSDKCHVVLMVQNMERIERYAQTSGFLAILGQHEHERH
jgi:hypothetical protein